MAEQIGLTRILFYAAKDLLALIPHPGRGDGLRAALGVGTGPQPAPCSPVLVGGVPQRLVRIVKRRPFPSISRQISLSAEDLTIYAGCVQLLNLMQPLRFMPPFTQASPTLKYAPNFLPFAPVSDSGNNPRSLCL